MQEGPVDGHSTSTVPGERVIDKPEHPPGGLYTDNTVHTEMHEGSLQLKRGTAGDFEIFCDEGANIGGSARYPTPMAYLAMATGFWLLTQVSRYAHMMKMEIKGASVSVRFRKLLGGSVLKGTVFNKWEAVDTHLKVESDEPADRLAHLIRNAKNGCFAEALITEPVPLHSTVEVNGEPFKIEGVTAD